VQGSGAAWTLVRPGGFAQNFSESFFLPGILQMGIVASATGEGAVAFVDADDIAAVAAAALTEEGHAGAAYAVTGAQALTFAEATAIIGRAAGRALTYRRISVEEMGAMLRGAGLPPEYAAVLLRDQAAIAAGGGARVSDAVERVTGRPPIAFADYAAAAAAAWR
jgi:uncharacterized protein YbjT (DUF2867 family)